MTGASVSPGSVGVVKCRDLCLSGDSMGISPQLSSVSANPVSTWPFQATLRCFEGGSESGVNVRAMPLQMSCTGSS